MSLIQRLPGGQTIEWITSSLYDTIRQDAHSGGTLRFLFCPHDTTRTNMRSCAQFRHPERMSVERLTIAIYDYERVLPEHRCTDARVCFRVGEINYWTGTLDSMVPYYEVLPGDEVRLGFSAALRDPKARYGCYIPSLLNFECRLDGLHGRWNKVVCVIAGQYGREVV